ncbi:hypothetical protein [Bradyrhizobium mercantei]|uniref:hypothetical protein n=1 Tax=Bradyrhizobium mercantei TaxID=1904807 RepID=UPI00097848E9|nr:hypothetical protein [Bradyrhizobium mercantei]
MSGVLAIWNDCARGRGAAYEEWYQQEHLAERLAVNGFVVGRRYEAIDAARQFLTTYEVETPAVLHSAAYRERLANPAERTARIMRDGLVNMRRTMCKRHAIRGDCRDGIALTVALNQPEPMARLQRVVGRWHLSSELAHSEIWIAAEREDAPSAEEKLRGADAKISGCLVLEFLRRDAALRCSEKVRRDVFEADVGVYQLMCALRGEDRC